MKIVDEKQNKLLNRKEVVLELDFKGKTTPSKVDLIKQVATQVKSKEDLIYVDVIDQAYGEASGSAKVFVYDTKDNLNKVHFYKKKKLLKQIREKDLADRKAAKEPAEKPAEAPAEAPKAEEKPAEVKEEAKPEEVKAEAQTAEKTDGEETKTEE